MLIRWSLHEELVSFWAKALFGFDATQSGGYSLVGEWVDTTLVTKTPNILEVRLGSLPPGIVSGSMIVIGGKTASGMPACSLWRLKMTPEMRIELEYIADIWPDVMLKPIDIRLDEIIKIMYQNKVISDAEKTRLSDIIIDRNERKRIEYSSLYMIGWLAGELGLASEKANTKEIEEHQRKVSSRLVSIPIEDIKMIENMNANVPLPEGYTWLMVINGTWLIKTPTNEVRFADCLLPLISSLPDVTIDLLEKSIETLGGLLVILGEMRLLRMAMNGEVDDPDSWAKPYRSPKTLR